jgi:hypothetical protein
MVAMIGGGIGVLPHLFPILISLFPTLLGGFGLTVLGGLAISAIWPIAYGFIIISTLYYRVRGIQL